MKIALTLLFTFNIALAKTIDIAVASMMHNLENESSIVFGDHVRKGIYLSLNHNKDRLKKAGLTINLKEYSYTSETSSILETAKKIQESNAIAVHGYDYSSHALISQNIHKDNNLSIILPTATSEGITTNTDNYFQIAGSNKSQAHAILKLMQKRDVKVASLIKREACAYCVDLSNQLEELASQYNTKIEVIIANTPDAIKKETQKYILLPMYEPEAIKFIKSLSKNNPNKTYIGGDGWTSKGERYFSLLDKLDFEALCLAHWNLEKKSPTSDKFKEDYLSFFGSNASDVSALSYDSMNFIIDGLVNTKDQTRENLKNYFKSKEKYIGITGDFDMTTQVKKGFVYLSWDKSSFRVLDEN